MPSTSIKRFTYDEESRILSVWFLASGKRYDYLGVPPQVFAGFERAVSKGRYFNTFIRDRYEYRLVDAA